MIDHFPEQTHYLANVRADSVQIRRIRNGFRALPLRDRLLGVSSRPEFAKPRKALGLCVTPYDTSNPKLPASPSTPREWVVFTGLGRHIQGEPYDAPGECAKRSASLGIPQLEITR